MSRLIGPRNPFCQQLHGLKYRQRGEVFDDYCVRYARTTADDKHHFYKLLECLRSQAVLPGGRQQRSVGWPFQTTAFNCFVGGTIPDDTRGIGDAHTEAMLTLRSGGGCGWDFSTLRPRGEPIRRLGDDAHASGPVSFMGIWHAMCNTIRSAGERRGAMMAVLRVEHPDVMTFVRCKKNGTELTNFNVSLAVTDEFMEALYAGGSYELRFGGRSFGRMKAEDVWAAVMENNWDWAEPGCLFIDRINGMNPLHYCETIAATNPCAEQPLPPAGACLLLSHNVVKYLVPSYARSARGSDGASLNGSSRGYEIDLDRLAHDVGLTVRACDNVFENTVFPLEAQAAEAFAKRRMGVGVTGVANALEVCGHRYGTDGYVELQSRVLEVVRDTAYRTSVEMARAKGAFPLFDADKWLASGFAQTLPEDIRWLIKKYGLRNGLLLSIAPTGTISLVADNVSSGIEAPPVIECDRTVQLADGPRQVALNDWAWEEHQVRCRTALECPPADHVKVLCAAQKYVDSSISKTTNFRGEKPGADAEERAGCVSFQDFKDVYRLAYDGGAKGCTTFNVNGKRMGIIRERADAEPPGEVCYTDRTGATVCG